MKHLDIADEERLLEEAFQRGSRFVQMVEEAKKTELRSD